MGPIGSEFAFDAVHALVPVVEPAVVVTLNVGGDTTVTGGVDLVGGGQTGVVPLQLAPGVGETGHPVVAETFVQSEGDTNVIPLRLGSNGVEIVKLSALGDREGPTVTGVGHIVLLALGGDDAHVLDGLVEVLVNETNRCGEVVEDLLFQAEGVLGLAHGLQIRIDGVEGGNTPVHGTDVGPGVVAVDADLVELIGVEGVVDVGPLETAEGTFGHLKLHDVVEDAEATVDLKAGVAVNVVDEAEPGSKLIPETELDRGVLILGHIAEGGDVLLLGPETEVQGQPALEDVRSPAVLDIHGPTGAVDVGQIPVGVELPSRVEAGADGVVPVLTGHVGHLQ